MKIEKISQKLVDCQLPINSVACNGQRELQYWMRAIANYGLIVARVLHDPCGNYLLIWKGGEA